MTLSSSTSPHQTPIVYAGPFEPKAFVIDPSPYAYPWIWEAWLPADEAPTINRVTAQSGTFPVPATPV